MKVRKLMLVSDKPSLRTFGSDQFMRNAIAGITQRLHVDNWVYC